MQRDPPEDRSSTGWAQIGSIATLAGILLIVFGVILFTLPVLNWLLNLGPESQKPRAA